MKGIYTGYFSMPNVERIEEYIVNQNENPTTMIRKKTMQVIAETINEHALSIKAKLADYIVCECGLTFKNREAEDKVASIVGNIFDIYAGATAESLEELIGEEAAE